MKFRRPLQLSWHVRTLFSTLVFMAVSSAVWCQVSSSTPPAEGSFSTKSVSAVTRTVQNASILIIQDALPWGSEADTTVLDELNVSYAIVNWSEYASVVLQQYPVVLIPNDQSSNYYGQYAAHSADFTNYVQNGGTLVFFSAAQGWNSGYLNTPLPGGTVWDTALHNTASLNEIVDQAHPIVTGINSDLVSLTNADLNGNSCSHGSFKNLPAGTNIILRESGVNPPQPTFIEYPLGSGRVLASTLTWEYSYDHPGAFAKKALDDVFLYALSGKPRLPVVDSIPPLEVGLFYTETVYGLNGQLTPNPFPIALSLANTLTSDTGTAQNVVAELSLADGLELAARQTSSHSLGNIPLGELVQTNWSVHVTGEPGLLRFDVQIKGANIPTKTITQFVLVAEGTSGPLGPPSGLTAFPGENKAVRLNWQDNSTRESGFEIETLKKGKSTLIGRTLQDTVDAFLGNISGKQLSYRVRAFLGSGDSRVYSNYSEAFATGGKGSIVLSPGIEVFPKLQKLQVRPFGYVLSGFMVTNVSDVSHDVKIIATEGSWGFFKAGIDLVETNPKSLFLQAGESAQVNFRYFDRDGKPGKHKYMIKINDMAMPVTVEVKR